MIGNDIVDLQAARKESDWKRRGFLQKLFTGSEQQIIYDSPDPEVMVWTLWSMKEAAYKIYNRETGIRAFIPHLLECKIVLDDILTGTVTIEERTYFTKSIVNNDAVHTIAVKNFIDFSTVTAINYAFISKDKAGLPYSNILGHENAVSISHHGRFRECVCII